MSEVPIQLADRLALSVREAAKVTGVSERHLRSILPEIPHVRLGGRVVIPVGPFAEWLRTRAEATKGKVDSAVDEIMESLGENR
jgi:excisionase family DNA binding protein